MSKKVCTFIGEAQVIVNEGEKSCISLRKRLRSEIERQITLNDASHFICDMALGISIFAAEEVLKFKKRYPNITLQAVLAYETLTNTWKEKDRNRFFEIMKNCDTETLLHKQYTEDCLSDSIHYIINNSDTVISIFDPFREVQYEKAVRYATEQKKEIVHLRFHNLSLDENDYEDAVPVMSERQKMAYDLRAQNKTYQEVAEIMGITRSAVQSLCYNAERKMRNSRRKKGNVKISTV